MYLSLKTMSKINTEDGPVYIKPELWTADPN